MEAVTCLIRLLLVYDGAARILSANSDVHQMCGLSYTYNLFATDSVQELLSPPFPENYHSNIDCSSTLRTASNVPYHYVFAKVVQSPPKPPNGGPCPFDVTAYDGSSFISRKIWSWCETGIRDITSTGRYLTIRYQTFNRTLHNEFKVQYLQISGHGDLPSCGPTSLEASFSVQYLSSPRYPLNYANNLNCDWKIRTKTGFYIKLTVLDAQMETDCQNDVVKVYDGYTAASLLLGTFCGSDKPAFVSTGNVVRVQFKTNGETVGRGFRMTYQIRNFTGFCGPPSLNAYDDVSYLTSPGYPENYRNNLDCTWVIRAQSGYNIKLAVQTAAIEPYGCVYDRVMVYDGPSSASSHLGTFCGTVTPGFVSSSNTVTVVFVTNNNTVDEGFKMSYKAGHFNGVCGSSSLNASSNVQYLQTPYRYYNDIDCIWIIKADGDYNIKLDVTSLPITADRCQNNFLAFYDASRGDLPLVGRVCDKDATPTFVSSANAVAVHLKTNAKSGGYLSLSYTSGHFTEGFYHSESIYLSDDTKYLTSPGYPYVYNNNLNCTWEIRTSYPQIKLEVTDADMEDSTECVSDRVQVYNEHSLIGTFCGKQTPTYIIPSSSARVVFITDTTGQGKGFKMTCTAGRYIASPVPYTCGSSSLTARNYPQDLASPVYPDYYPNVVDCTWTIEASYGYVVYVEVTNINMESQYECSAAYLEIFEDDPPGYRSSLGKWCGPYLPTPTRSSGQMMSIAFHSDRNLRKSVFHLRYASQPNFRQSHQDSVKKYIIGGTTSGCVVVFILLVVGYVAKRSCKKQRSVPSNSMTHPTGLPSYDDVVSSDQGQEAEDSPPPYNQNSTSERCDSSSASERSRDGQTGDVSDGTRADDEDDHTAITIEATAGGEEADTVPILPREDI